jgi:cobalt-zinc-cadmium efflux system outer membrane protein
MSPAETMTLEQAIAVAMDHSPRLAACAAERLGARADLRGAETFAHNPELDVEAGDRSTPGGGSSDLALRLRQEFEIAGQRGARRRVARSRLSAAESQCVRGRADVVATVTVRFVELLRARDVRVLSAADVELSREMLAHEERRLAAGSGTQITVNVARAAAGRALHRLRADQAGEAMARARLLEVLGVGPITGLRVAGVLAPPPALGDGADRSLDALVRRGLAARHDLEAARHGLEAARHRRQLQGALAVPNLTVGAFSEREESADIAGLSVAVSIPLFHRNQGGIARADAEIAGATAELTAKERAIEAEIAVAFARDRAAGTAARELAELSAGALEESVDLLRRAHDAGKVGATDVLVLRRELFAARRERIDAVAEAMVARAELDLAMGGALSGLAVGVAEDPS